MANEITALGICFTLVLFAFAGVPMVLGILFRICLKSVRPDLSALLAAALFLLFQNFFSRSGNPMLTELLETVNSAAPSFCPFSAIVIFLIGGLAIPFIMARWGVNIVDWTRKRAKENAP